MKYNRILDIKKFIVEKGSVTIDELLNKFNVSMPTLRRDISTICKDEKFIKVYGGIYYDSFKLKKTVNPLSEREEYNLESKKYIGEIASKFIDENDVVFIDSGTTAIKIIPHLHIFNNVTVISHSLDVINLASNYKNIKLICMGGSFDVEYRSFFPDLDLNKYSFDKCFISTVGINEYGLSNIDYKEGIIKNKVINKSKKVILMADNSKFSVSAFNKFSNIKDLDIIVTDKKPDKLYLDIFIKNNIKIIY